MYQLLFGLIFRHLDPELMHRLGTIFLEFIGRFLAPVRRNGTELMGLHFENRLGIAAGFDKNAKHVEALYRLGFGHVEVGTVTPEPQPGNPRPRMFRIWTKRAIINRMGFNNDGADLVAVRLKRLRENGKDLPVIGVNIGKNKTTPPELAANDYQKAAKALAAHADYLAVNVSSPNTPGLRDLQQIQALRPILKVVQKESLGKPVLVKIAPDLSDQDVEAVADLVNELDLAGVIAANTTLGRDAVVGLPNAEEVGGLSGPMLSERALEMLELLRPRLKPGKVIVSVGGVTTRQDLADRLNRGADLVQAYTGFVYGGPLWPRSVQAP